TKFKYLRPSSYFFFAIAAFPFSNKVSLGVLRSSWVSLSGFLGPVEPQSARMRPSMRMAADQASRAITPDRAARLSVPWLLRWMSGVLKLSLPRAPRHEVYRSRRSDRPAHKRLSRPPEFPLRRPQGHRRWSRRRRRPPRSARGYRPRATPPGAAESSRRRLAGISGRPSPG